MILQTAYGKNIEIPTMTSFPLVPVGSQKDSVDPAICPRQQRLKNKPASICIRQAEKFSFLSASCDFQDPYSDL